MLLLLLEQWRCLVCWYGLAVVVWQHSANHCLSDRFVSANAMYSHASSSKQMHCR
jgi:hypothetical protein